MILFTVYRTQNICNGRYYFGVHKAKNPYDGYLGSGKVLKRAVAKYGEQNFIKNVCFVFDHSEEAFAKEFELIETYRADPLCYNLRQGGSGGFDWINQNGLANYVEAGNKNTDLSKERWRKDPTYRNKIQANLAKSPATGSSELAKKIGLAAIGCAAAAKRNRKEKERVKAVELHEQGLSNYKIAKILEVSKSSITIWLKDLG